MHLGGEIRNIYILLLLSLSISFSQVSMNFVGDIMLGRRYVCQVRVGDNWGVNDSLQDCFTDVNEWCEDPGILTLYDPEFISNAIKEFIDNADISNANLEIVITDDISTPFTEEDPDKIIFHSCPEDMISLLSNLGIDVIDLANNHILDYLEIGLNETQQYLEENSILYYGAGNNEEEACSPEYLTIAGINVAFLGSSNRGGYDIPLHADENNSGFCFLDEPHIVSQISNIENADIIIYQMHSGKEYSTEPRLEINDKGEDEGYNPFYTEPTREDREIRQFAIDEGADIVVCHHPHVLQGLELYNNKLIAHSLGNFIFDQRYPETYPSMILSAGLNSNEFYDYSITPIYLYSYMPQRTTGDLGNHILDYIAMKSRKLGTFLYVDRDSSQAFIQDDAPSYEYTYSKQITYSDSNGGYYYSDPVEIEKIGSIANLSCDSNIEYRLGREILWRGDFEFNPLDLTEFNENEHPYLLFWSVKNDNADQDENIVNTESHSGVYSFMHYNNTDSKIYSEMNNCFPIDTNYEYTAKGYIKTENVSNAKFGIRYFRSNDSIRCAEDIGDEYIGAIIGTTINWSEEYFNMDIPEGTDYIDFRMESSPPIDANESHVYFDDLEVIQWEDWQDINVSIELLYPNDYYYVQFRSSNQDSNWVNFTEFTYNAEDIPEECINGDLNGDGVLNVLDVVALVNCILANNCDECSDINADATYNVLDIVTLVNIILT